MELGRLRANSLERRLVQRDELEVVPASSPDVGGPRQVLEVELEQALVDSAAENLLQRILRPPLGCGHGRTAPEFHGAASLPEPGRSTHDMPLKASRRGEPVRAPAGDAAATCMDNTARPYPPSMERTRCSSARTRS